MKKFKLSHVTLYAKGWYEKTDDVYSDLKVMLELDDYTPFTNTDVYMILLNNFTEASLGRYNDLSEVLINIDPKSNSIYTYKGEWDMRRAVIHYILENLRFLDSDKWEKAIPKYKVFPKNKNISTKAVIEMFNKNEAYLGSLRTA